MPIDLTQLTEKQKRKLEKLAKLVDEGGIATLEHLMEMEDKMDSFMEKCMKEMEDIKKEAIPNLKDVLEQVKGKDGKTPVLGEDYTIPDPIPGQDGEDYVLTEQDKRDIAKNIKVPIVEKVIERTEVIKEQPIITEVIKTVENPVTGEEVVKKINDLPLEEEYKIDVEHINGLDEKFDKIKSEIGRSSSGGITDLRIQQAFKYILKTQQPTGLINGSNTTYTVSQPIFAILSMTINGETIAQLPNYTIKGNQIIFSTALPAAYSGKDWEVKYI